MPLTSAPAGVRDSDLVLEETNEPMNSGSSCTSCQSYDLYLDEMNSENGGEGSITTLEPSGAHQEESAFGGVEFRSAEMISDLLIYGRDNTDKVTLFKIRLLECVITPERVIYQKRSESTQQDMLELREVKQFHKSFMQN